MRTLLFSCGFGSGGTDLIKNILNAHPDIYIASEITSLANIAARGYNHKTSFSKLAEVQSFQRLLRDLEGGHIFENIEYDFSRLIEEKGIIQLEDVVRLCLSHKEKDVSVWGAKGGSDKMAILSNFFPKAKFLLVTRDVRDVCLSWRNKWGKNMTWCAAKWAERMAKSWEFASLTGAEGCLVIKFEDMITETERSCHDMCNFLGIPFSERMLNYHKYTERWKGKRNYGQPIISTNKEKWRLELGKKTITRIEEIAYNTMNLLGYQAELAAESKPISRYEKLQGVCHDMWAILFVGNRTLKKRNTLGLRMKTALGVLRGLLLCREQKRSYSSDLTRR